MILKLGTMNTTRIIEYKQLAEFSASCIRQKLPHEERPAPKENNTYGGIKNNEYGSNWIFGKTSDNSTEAHRTPHNKAEHYGYTDTRCNNAKAFKRDYDGTGSINTSNMRRRRNSVYNAYAFWNSNVDRR